MLTALVVDDDEDARAFVVDALRDRGDRIVEAADGVQAIAEIKARKLDAVITDVRLPGADGHAILRAARERDPRIAVVLMTSFAGVKEAVSALRDGAYDYLTKPFAVEELDAALRPVRERLALERELEAARRALSPGSAIERTLIGSSTVMRRLRDRIVAVAPSDASVLVTGESGTGKELVARAIHESSGRRDAPLVAVNCAAFPETLLEAELFGYERGAFTGATKRRPGRLVTADGGTLFLDEIGEMPLAAQAKLLRVLEDGKVTPLGSDRATTVDVRVVSATNRDLKARIAEGAFREDLYYRLVVMMLHVPPLRDRREDLPELVEHFLTHHGGAPKTMSREAMGALARAPFPGNVRELAHAIQHAVILAQGPTIELVDLPEDLAPPPSVGRLPLSSLGAEMKRHERDYLLRALSAASGKRARAAEMLGISRKSLWEKLRAHGIDDSDIEPDEKDS